MDDDTLHDDGGLFPELAPSEPALPCWEVTFRVRRRDGGEPLGAARGAVWAPRDRLLDGGGRRRGGDRGCGR